MQKQPPSRKFSLSYSLGLERLGLVPLRYTWAALLAVLIISALAAACLNRMKVDDSLSELFRANTPEFKKYEYFSTQFPSTEHDVLVVVEGRALLERDNLNAFRNTVIDLQLVEGVRGIVSLFSAREPPEPGKLPAPLVPGDLPEGAEYEQLVQNIKTNRIVGGKLISPDGTLALAVLALDPAVTKGDSLQEVIREIRKSALEDMAGTGITVQLAGAPVMQLEIRNAVERDRLIYNVLGFVIGALVAMAFFRHLSFMIIAAVPPAVAILWALGLLGWSGFKLNLFLNVISPLTMVMGFADSMQITFAIRDRLLEGDSRADAVRYAITVVGPACVLNGATAALSFLTLTLSDSALIQTFGIAGALCMISTYFAVITVLPLLAVAVLSRHPGAAAKLASRDWAMEFLRRTCFVIAERVSLRPLAVAGLGLGLVIGFGVAHYSLTPRYRLADQVPDREQAVKASGRLDMKLTGANPIDVLVEMPAGRKLFEPEALAVIGAVHRTVEEQAGVGNVWSIETLVRWLAEAGQANIPTLRQYISFLPPHLTQRFVDATGNAAVVTGRIPDKDSSDLLPLINRLDTKLDAVRAQYPGYSINVTGLSVIAARNSAAMIGKINMSLTAEMVFVSLLIGLAFRSLLLGAVSLLPGLFPVVTSGAVLAMTGQGLQFASIIALTVAFGLGLNATIHYLNRLRLEEQSSGDSAVNVTRAAVLMGPALILTSLVLACGLAVTMFSGLPSLRVFGQLSATTLIAAMIGGLFLLPACVLLVRRTQAAGGRMLERRRRVAAE